MSDSSQPQSGPLSFIRNAHDFWCGVSLILLAPFGVWALRNLPNQPSLLFGLDAVPLLLVCAAAIGGVLILTRGAVAGGPPIVQNPRDFWGGLGILIVACIAWWASRNLPGQQGFAFGPGTAPRLFITLLGINGIGILTMGVFTTGPTIERWNFRGVLFVLGAVLVFAATIRPLGLIISTFLLVMVSSAGSQETKWIQTVIWAAVLAAFCAFLFPYVLNLPMQLWPRF